MKAAGGEFHFSADSSAASATLRADLGPRETRRIVRMKSLMMTDEIMKTNVCRNEQTVKLLEAKEARKKPG